MEYKKVSIFQFWLKIIDILVLSLQYNWSSMLKTKLYFVEAWPLEHPWQICQMSNIWHIWHTKHQKTPHNKCSICAKFLPFVSVPLQICNSTDTNAKPENNILFDFSLSSQFFIWFFLYLLKIYLSPKFSTRVLPLLTIKRKQEAHLRRRRRWWWRPREEERQP